MRAICSVSSKKIHGYGEKCINYSISLFACILCFNVCCHCCYCYLLLLWL